MICDSFTYIEGFTDADGLWKTKYKCYKCNQIAISENGTSPTVCTTCQGEREAKKLKNVRKMYLLNL